MSVFVESLGDVFERFGRISSKKMFGGYGIYHQGVMIALVADDELYLKSDKEIADRYQALGLQPFNYEKNGKTVQMSYYQAPEEIFDDPESAREWALLAYGAALRAKKKK